MMICGYNAEGPFLIKNALNDENELDQVRNEPGIYIILGSEKNLPDWEDIEDMLDSSDIVDVGKSEKVQKRIREHDRSECWDDQGFNALGVAVIYEDRSFERTLVEIELRDKFDPPCGKR